MAHSPNQGLLAFYLEFLNEDSAPMRRVAVWEIGRLGDPAGAVHLVRAICGDPDWECRHYAIMALANVGGPEEAAQLRGLVADEYLSPNADSPAGPAPEGLRDHLAADLERTAQCCAGELPRPTAAQDQHGEWWRRQDL